MTYIQGFMVRDIYDQLFFDGWISVDELEALRFILIRHYAKLNYGIEE